MNLHALTGPLDLEVSWYSEDFIYNSVVEFLKSNGYKIHKENCLNESVKNEKIITASKFLKKEVIEVKGFTERDYKDREYLPELKKNTQIKTWFLEGFFNSFMNFSLIDNAEIAMALPNISRYKSIITKLNDYFTTNNLHFRIYLVNEDGSVEVSNLNEKYAGIRI